jgi:hypothetical protein
MLQAPVLILPPASTRLLGREGVAEEQVPPTFSSDSVLSVRIAQQDYCHGGWETIIIRLTNNRACRYSSGRNE